MRRLEGSGRWGLVVLPACPACFSLPFPALPCPSQPHGSVSWSRACTRGQPSSTRAAREEPPAAPALLRASASRTIPTAPSTARSIPQPRASPQPGASLPVLSPLAIPNIPASSKHSSSPEHTCSPESLWESLAASLQSPTPLAASPHPWKHPCSPGHPWQHSCKLPGSSPSLEHSPTSLRTFRPPGPGD